MNAHLCISMLVALSNSCFGLNMPNAPCLRDELKPYRELLHHVSLFPEDNRVILEDHAADFGIDKKVMDRARTAMGELVCPSDKKGEVAIGLSATLFETNDTIVTNLHGIRNDETMKLREPLTDCMFATQDEMTRGVKGHELNLEKGEEGFAKAIALNHLAVGKLDRSNEGLDYAVIRLKTPVRNAVPFKLPSSPLGIHGCKVEEPDTCQKLIGMSAHDVRMPGGEQVPWGKTVVQSFNVYNLRPLGTAGDSPTRIYGNRSTQKGVSGGMNFLADKDGHAILHDGYLVPVAMVVTGANIKFDGQEYNGGANLVTRMIGLDGSLAASVRRVSGQR